MWFRPWHADSYLLHWDCYRLAPLTDSFFFVETLTDSYGGVRMLRITSPHDKLAEEITLLLGELDLLHEAQKVLGEGLETPSLRFWTAIHELQYRFSTRPSDGSS